MEPLETSLSEEAQRRYLNYALSVITSRALPDVRDGLKPVQRRILYAMLLDLRLAPDAKHTKSAKIVGQVIGNYHPHGDTAAYDAMVRLAQPWVMRAPLVDGQGNFGSADGDGAAAYRYTEAKLRPIAMELLSELGKRTVGWRPNFDGTTEEPIVLPTRFPHLLVNGSQGIAVGMATSIPPHNLNEVIDACVAEIDAETPLTTKQLLKFIKGPDFPTAGQLLATKDELVAIYESGSGTLKLRAEHKLEDKRGGGVDIVLTSTPYGVERGTIVEKIAEIIVSKKLPALVDVRDESTTDVRIVLEVKKGTDPQLVLAYLYKATPLSTTVSVNLTCLVPATDDDGNPKDDLTPPAPERLSLGKMIRHFLDFRMLTVGRRIAFDLEQLQKRIHVLEGFEKVFDALDETIRIIRKSEGKADAQKKLVARFELSEEQSDAILELRLYRLAQLEILLIRKELAEKRAEARRLDALLKSEPKRWQLIKEELYDIKAKYGDKRRTRITGDANEPEFAAEDFITAEDVTVLLTTQGWIKRAREIKDLSTTRVREGDAVLAAEVGSTRSAVAFFSNYGACYVMRIHDVPASTGYGDPVQKFFKMDDGERIIGLMSFDPRRIAVPAPAEGEPQPPFALAVTRGGLGFRFSLAAHGAPSTKAGRKYAKLNEGDEVVLVTLAGDRDFVVCGTSDCHVLAVPVDEISVASGAAKGAMVMKVEDKERVVGAQLCVAKRDVVTFETEKGKTLDVTVQSSLGKRADKGEQLLKRDRFARLVPPAPTSPSLTEQS